MTGDNLLSQMSRQMLRGTALFLKHRYIIALCSLGTLLPPEAQRRHIMGGDGGDTTLRIAVEVSELETALLGQCLYLEGEDAEGVEDWLHTIG